MGDSDRYAGMGGAPSGRRPILWRAYATLARLASVVNRLPLGERSVRVEAGRLYVETLDRYLAAVLWKLGWLETEERGLIAREVKAGMTVVDVGANIGLHTLGLARCVGPSGRVHALEPEPRNFRLLARAVKAARLDHVRLHAAAAAERDGSLALYLSDANQGDHRAYPDVESRHAVTVPAVSLDDVLAEEPKVDFMKIDVQGFELHAMRGMARTLRRSPDIGVLCELCPELLRSAGGRPEELLRLLGEAGLVPHRIRSSGAHAPIEGEEALAIAESWGYVNLYFRRPASGFASGPTP